MGNGPMTDAANYALLAQHLKTLGYETSPDLTILTAIVAEMDNSVLREWYTQKCNAGAEVTFTVNFHLNK